MCFLRRAGSSSRGTLAAMNGSSKLRPPADPAHTGYRDVLERGAVNIFVYGRGEHFDEIGYHSYMFPNGMAETRINEMLRERAETDFALPRRHTLSRRMSSGALYGTMRREPWALEQVGNIIASGVRYCITPVVNGQPRADQTLETLNGYAVDDYLAAFRTDNGFIDLISLIDGDFVEPIRCLFKAQLYVAAVKLTMSMVDTLGFIEFGPQKGVFQQWLNTYADLSGLNVSAEELWELRNSLVHMTNLASRNVESGRVEGLTFVITGADVETPERLGGIKVLHLTRLLSVTLPHAIGQWVRTYYGDTSKRNLFVHRYDTIVSESRIKAFAARANEKRDPPIGTGQEGVPDLVEGRWRLLPDRDIGRVFMRKGAATDEETLQHRARHIHGQQPGAGGLAGDGRAPADAAGRVAGEGGTGHRRGDRRHGPGDGRSGAADERRSRWRGRRRRGAAVSTGRCTGMACREAG